MVINNNIIHYHISHIRIYNHCSRIPGILGYTVRINLHGVVRREMDGDQVEGHMLENAMRCDGM